MKRLSRSALFGLAALLLFSCALCAIIAVISPEPEPEAALVAEAPRGGATVAVTAAGAAAEPTAADDEPAATATAAPSATPQPTATAEPTAAPTRTPQPTADAPATRAAAEATAGAATAEALAQAGVLEELAYATRMQDIARSYVSAMEGISDQSSAASDNPYLILSDDWKLTTALYLAQIRVTNSDVRALEPPARFVAVHADLLEAADYYDLVVKYYSEGVDEMDANKLNLAAANMNLGTLAIGRATDKLQALAD